MVMLLCCLLLLVEFQSSGWHVPSGANLGSIYEFAQATFSGLFTVFAHKVETV
jgi:hypothetical protein